MFKKTTLLVISLACSFALNAMEKGKNIISEQLVYTNHALERMEKRQVSRDEIKQVLHTGKREWDLEDRGAERFVERKNKINPLMVVLDRSKNPNVVVTVIKADPIVKYPVRTLTAGRSREEEYLKGQKAKKEKDLQREEKDFRRED
jgi:hypothetical protein